MSMSAWLGNPAGAFGMVALPDIEIGGVVGSRGNSTTLTRSTVTYVLASGGVTTLRKPLLKKQYSIGWSILTPSEVDTINSFFDGRQGVGPFCLVDPSWGNQLPPNVSSMGAVLSSVAEWTPTVGALATSATAGPTGFTSGVAAWTGSANASILYMGAVVNTLDGTWMPPVVTGVSHRMSIWAKLASGTGTLTAAMLYGVAGATSSGAATATAPATALNTSTWVEVPVTVASSFSWPGTADYVTLKLTVSSATSPSILLAAPSMVYDTVTNAAALSPWVAGVGVPRVNVVGDAPAPVDIVGWRDYTLTLQES